MEKKNPYGFSGENEMVDESEEKKWTLFAPRDVTYSFLGRANGDGCVGFLNFSSQTNPSEA